MTVTRKIPPENYSQQERDVLLTGVPLHPKSTRFGHPKTGWNVAEIEKAWSLLADALLPEWESEKYARCRERDGRPFAERLLAGAVRVRWGPPREET